MPGGGLAISSGLAHRELLGDSIVALSLYNWRCCARKSRRVDSHSSGDRSRSGVRIATLALDLGPSLAQDWARQAVVAARFTIVSWHCFCSISLASIYSIKTAISASRDLASRGLRAGPHGQVSRSDRITWVRRLRQRCNRFFNGPQSTTAATTATSPHIQSTCRDRMPCSPRGDCRGSDRGQHCRGNTIWAPEGERVVCATFHSPATSFNTSTGTGIAVPARARARARARAGTCLTTGPGLDLDLLRIGSGSKSSR